MQPRALTNTHVKGQCKHKQSQRQNEMFCVCKAFVFFFCCDGQQAISLLVNFLLVSKMPSQSHSQNFHSTRKKTLQQVCQRQKKLSSKLEIFYLCQWISALVCAVYAMSCAFIYCFIIFFFWWWDLYGNAIKTQSLSLAACCYDLLSHTYTTTCCFWVAEGIV